MKRWVTVLLANWKERFTPFNSWLGELRNIKTLKADAVAGLTVALVLVPQSMAYAQLAGLPAYVGLYASFLPVMFAALWGSSRQLATGPVAIVSLMSAASLQSILGESPSTETYLFYAAFLAIAVGIFQLALGLLQLGKLVDFLSHPVVIGFTNAAALIIATSQLSKLFGISVESGEHHYETVWNILLGIPHTHVVTLIIAVFSIFVLVYLKKVAPSLPNVLIAVVLCTLISWGVGFEALGGQVIGDIASGLPGFSIPRIDFSHFTQLFMSAMIIALIGFVEAISVSKAIASQTRQRLSANQELVGQGVANITAGLFQGYAVSGSFSRSAVNYAADARTGFSSIVTGLLVAVTLLFLTPLLYHLPQATLAAVIMVAVLNLIKFEPVLHAWKVEPHDGIVVVVTFFATLVVAPHLEKGIMVGVVLSLGLFLYRTMSPNFVEVARHPDGSLRDSRRHHLQTSETVAVYRFDGDLYFANTGYLEGKILNSVANKPKLKVLVLDMEAVDQVDSTGEEMLEKLADRLKSAGIEFFVARIKLRVYEAFQRSGLSQHIGENRFFRERTLAVKHAKEMLGDAIDIEPLLRAMPAAPSKLPDGIYDG
ncbi:MAG: SulP family inorganic anion transporter [Thiolinea sp.]